MTARTVSMGNARSSNKARKHDRYMTPPEAVEALLAAPEAVAALLDCVVIPYRIWEPCCGTGNIVRVLRSHGLRVVASDLVEHGRDFLHTKSMPPRVQAIVTNPPYRLAAQFVRHALQLGVPYVAMLLRLNFVEGVRRADVLDKLSAMYVFANRLPPMHREGWRGKRVTSATTAYAWFVWDKAHRGPTIIQRIRWSVDVPECFPIWTMKEAAE